MESIQWFGLFFVAIATLFVFFKIKVEMAALTIFLIGAFSLVLPYVDTLDLKKFGILFVSKEAGKSLKESVDTLQTQVTKVGVIQENLLSSLTALGKRIDTVENTLISASSPAAVAPAQTPDRENDNPLFLPPQAYQWPYKFPELDVSGIAEARTKSMLPEAGIGQSLEALKGLATEQLQRSQDLEELLR